MITRIEIGFIKLRWITMHVSPCLKLLLPNMGGGGGRVLGVVEIQRGAHACVPWHQGVTLVR